MGTIDFKQALWRSMADAHGKRGDASYGITRIFRAILERIVIKLRTIGHVFAVVV